MKIDKITETVLPFNSIGIAARSSVIDQLRIIAAFAVIIVHVAGDLLLEGTSGSYKWWVGNITDSILRWCVPVFVLISGTLLLDPLKKEAASQFYLKRIKRIFIPLVFWSIFYICYQMFHSKFFTINQAIKLVVQGRPYNHLWYLYMMLGLYIFTPVFRLTIQGMSKKLFLTLTILLLIMSAMEEVLSKFYFGSPGTTSGIVMFLPYIGYFFAGGFIRKFGIKKIKFIFLGASFCICALVIIICTYIFTLFSIDQNKYYFYSFTNPFVAILSISIFIFFRQLSDLNISWIAKIGPFINKIAPATFGIYLIHPFIIDIIVKLKINFPSFYPHDPIAGLILSSLLIFYISMHFTLFIQRIPKIKSIVG